MFTQSPQASMVERKTDQLEYIKEGIAEHSKGEGTRQGYSNQFQKTGSILSSRPTLAARTTPDKLVSITEKLSKKEQTRAQCYAALYLLSEGKTQAAAPFLRWVK
ncbi:MAG: hypothetical protein K2X93_10155 [Candidatus Obscuribacterales bacterium]|nr:hypothetical protein [Candidatus Obscuribacterales bacterium]